MSGRSGQASAPGANHVSRFRPADEYPYLPELTFEHVLKTGYDFSDSFEFGLELIIEGLDRAAKAK